MTQEATVDQATLATSKSQAWDLFGKADYQRSLELYNTFLQNQPEDSWCLHDRARTLIELGGTNNLQQATADLSKLKAKFPQDAQITVSLAIASGRAGDYARCLANYKEAQMLNPDNYEVKMVGDLNGNPQDIAHHLHDLGLANLQKGNFREALRYYDLAVTLGGEGNAAWSLFDKGQIFSQMGLYDEAIAILERVRRLLPNENRPALELAKIYQTLSGKGERGKETKEEAIVEKDRRMSELQTQLNEAQAKMKIDHDSLKTLETLLKGTQSRFDVQAEELGRKDFIIDGLNRKIRKLEAMLQDPRNAARDQSREIARLEDENGKLAYTTRAALNMLDGKGLKLQVLKPEELWLRILGYDQLRFSRLSLNDKRELAKKIRRLAYQQWYANGNANEYGDMLKEVNAWVDKYS